MTLALRCACLLLAAAAAGCAVSPPVQAERDALAVFNRCVVAQHDMNSAQQKACLSTRLLAERALEEGEVKNPQQRLEARRDTRPFSTKVQSIVVAPDLNTVTLRTHNFSGVLDQKIEHDETIVLIRENGRWVVDKDCCDYRVSRIVDEQGKPLQSLPSEPQGEIERQTEPLIDYGAEPEPPPPPPPPPPMPPQPGY